MMLNWNELREMVLRASFVERNDRFEITGDASRVHLLKGGNEVRRSVKIAPKHVTSMDGITHTQEAQSPLRASKSAKKYDKANRNQSRLTRK